MPPMDYTKLLDRAREKGQNQKSLAALIGLSESHLCRKLSGEYAFKQSEISTLCDVLNIEGEEIGSFFFCAKT